MTTRRQTRRPDDGGGGKLFVSFKIGLFYGVDLVRVGRGDLGFFRLRFFLPCFVLGCGLLLEFFLVVGLHARVILVCRIGWRKGTDLVLAFICLFWQLDQGRVVYPNNAAGSGYPSPGCRTRDQRKSFSTCWSAGYQTPHKPRRGTPVV